LLLQLSLKSCWRYWVSIIKHWLRCASIFPIFSLVNSLTEHTIHLKLGFPFPDGVSVLNANCHNLCVLGTSKL
jgi:hypothetical protein